MLKNYLKIAIRHLWKHKRYVAINLFGLALALAMCILAYLSWRFDQDFDRFHSSGDQLFRLLTSKQSNHQLYGVSPLPLAEAAEEHIAGVQAGIPIDWRTVVLSDGKETQWERITYTEPDFFEWFSFPVVAGRADLSRPDHLLISEEMAEKYFGTADPIGRSLILHPGEEYRRDLVVVGVLENSPLNSSLQLDFITHIDNAIGPDGAAISTLDWSYLTDAVFLVLKSPADRQRVTEYLQDYLPTYNAAREDWQADRFELTPLIGMAAGARDLRWDSMQPALPPSMIWGANIMAILLLLTACLNFTNMTTSLAGLRLKEIGVRKVMGGSRKQLIGQLLSEGLLMSLAGLVLGLLLIWWILPYYNQMWRFLDLKLSFADNGPLVAFLIGVVVLTTLLAAAYPAFYISGFSPTRIFRGKVRFAGNTLLSRILLGAQVAIAALAIVTGIAFARNADFQQKADLGFQREGIQAVFTGNEQMFTVMEQQAEQLPQVVATAGVRFHIGDSSPRVDVQLRDQNHEADFMRVGEDYLETMNIRLLQGRSFDYELPSDYEQTVLVNEEFVRQYLTGEDPIGQRITVFDTAQYVIAGVVGNFLQDSFFDPMRPLVISLARADQFRYLVVRSEAGDMAAVRTELERSWRENFPDQPFEHYYQNDFLAGGLEVTNNVKQMFLLFSIITLFLTIAGLASLLSLHVMKRLKEVTIRRILGAAPAQIAYLLSSRFFLLVVLSLILGGIGGMFMSRALLDSIFGWHVGVSVQALFVAAGLILLVTVLTVASRIIGVIFINPAQTLNRE